MTDARILQGSLTVLALLLILSGAAAQTPPRPASPVAPQVAPQAPPLFGRTGVINSIDPATGAIVINDVRYRLPESVRVYTYDRALKDPAAQRAEGRLKHASALREGQRVGYNVTGEGGGQRGTLTEAWLLPAGKLPELPSGENSPERGKPGNPGTAQEERSQRPDPRARTTR
ncbi:MAG: hypothetical protein AB7N91_28820 [Candidatus Tectimicrobiota bacterium]